MISSLFTFMCLMLVIIILSAADKTKRSAKKCISRKQKLFISGLKWWVKLLKPDKEKENCSYRFSLEKCLCSPNWKNEKASCGVVWATHHSRREKSDFKRNYLISFYFRERKIVTSLITLIAVHIRQDEGLTSFSALELASAFRA